MTTIRTQQIFLPAKNFAQSIDFYVRMGWELKLKEDALAHLQLGASLILLQDYYNEDWAGNTMVYLVVDDPDYWYDLAQRVKRDGEFDSVKVMAPKQQQYGAVVTHVIDPAGVLLHFAGPVK